MSPPTVGPNIFRRGASSATILIGAVIFVSACGGGESSEAAAAGSPEAMAAESSEADLSPGAGGIAPLGTGFIVVSERSQLWLEEPGYVEEADCLQRVAALQDPKEYAGCMEIPPTAFCLQVSVGFREDETWWECFVEPVVCEDRMAEHDMLWQLVKDDRAILQPCAERELAEVFG